MRSMMSIKQAFHRWIGEPPPCNNANLREDETVISIGRRAYCRRVEVGGTPHVKKVFTSASPGREAFARELLAHNRLRSHDWMPAWKDRGLNWYIRPLYPETARLDVVAADSDTAQRRHLASEALSIALDLYCAGFAHRDFNASNLYWIDGCLKLVDYETLVQYAADERPPFWTSYDITGQGLDSPFVTNNMGFFTKSPMSIASVLGVDLDECKDALAVRIKKELRDASLTFQTTRTGRHRLRSELTYSTFRHPDLEVSRAEAQRNCQRRFEQFGIELNGFANRRVLDLGSNIGGMSLFAQNYGPSHTLGVEYDQSKVDVARRAAAFCGYTKVEFLQADLDKASVRSLGGTYDVVFCLAIDSHVRKQQRLYKLLGRVTREVLYFEGNADSDTKTIAAILEKQGFASVEYLGCCDDDILPENNRRPLLKAMKYETARDAGNDMSA